MINKLKNLFPNTKGENAETLSEFICCCLSCWLLSTGACILFDSQFEFEAGVITILWQTAVSMIIIAIASRKWWIPPILIGSILLVIGVIITFENTIGNSTIGLSDFLKWLIDFMPENSPWYSKKGIYLIHTFINLGVSIGFFTVIRLTRKSWIIAIISIVIIIGIYSFGYAEYNILALVFYFMGIFSLIALDKFTGHKLFNRKNIFSVLGNKWIITVISIFICLVISLSTILIFNNEKKLDIRNRFSSNIAADIQSLFQFYTEEQRETKCSLYSLGLQNNKSYIGGDLPRLESVIIATTDLKSSTLVKITSFGAYNGKRWYNKFEETYRFNGPFKEKQTAYLSSKLIDKDFNSSPIQSICQIQEVNFTLKDDSFFLPSLGQTLDFSEKTPTKNPILFDGRGQILSYYGQKKGYTYSLKSLVYLTNRKLSPQYTFVMNQITSQKDPYYTKEFKEYYTNLETNLSRRAIDILEIFKTENLNAYNTALRICEHFSYKNGYRYTEFPPTFYETDDVVDKLLYTKRGHCVYYSTAMVTMLRYLGIPSRLAAGYKTAFDENGTQVVVSSHPYAWVECYLPNMGWISFDPTPKQPLTTTGNEQSDNSGQENPEHQQEEIMTPEVEESADDIIEIENQPISKEEKTVSIKLIILIIIFALIITYLICRIVFLSKFYEIDFVKKRFISTNKQAEFYWRDILRLFICMGCIRKRNETVRELGNRVCDKLPLELKETVLNSISIIEALRYGDISPNDENIITLYKTIISLEEAVKQKLNPIIYFIIRRLLRPIL